MQVTELHQANADVRCHLERQGVDVNIQQKLSGQSLQVSMSNVIIIITIINEEEIRVTLSHRDVAGALYIN